jgi:very-short-patch-repair endonuclease
MTFSPTLPKRRRMPRAKTEQARARRQAPSPSEAVLWAYLRRHRGRVRLRWRRQAPIYGYVVDFYCPALGLVIEVDRPWDAERHANLAGHGLRVLRVAVADVFTNLSVVLAEIAAAADRTVAA